HPENKSVKKLYERKNLDVISDHKLSHVIIGDNKKDRLSIVRGKRGKSPGLNRRMGIKLYPLKDILPEPRFGNEIAQKEMSIKNSADVSVIYKTNPVARSDSSGGNGVELNSKVLSDIEGKLLEQIEIIKSSNAVGKETEIKIKLSPPELGELKLTVLIKEGKRLRASFVTDTTSAGKIINGGGERLSEAILRHGFVLENLDVSVGNPGDNAEKGKWDNFSEASGNSEVNQESNEKRVPVTKLVGDRINLLV
ncbi:flagellar hook-length control protein FliK, partial [bacterium]|nr:flagellar hook-length control protein FliK [bacterium]